MKTTIFILICIYSYFTIISNTDRFREMSEKYCSFKFKLNYILTREPGYGSCHTLPYPVDAPGVEFTKQLSGIEQQILFGIDSSVASL